MSESPSSSSSSSSSDSEIDQLVIEQILQNQRFIQELLKPRLNSYSSSESMEEEEDGRPGSTSPIPSSTHTADSDPDPDATFSDENPNNSVHDLLGQVTSPPPAKRPRSTHPTQTLDRISLLPDSILHQILSQLPIQEAVASGILSKRWKYTWTSLPNLIFKNNRSWDDGLEDFVSFVNNTILLYGNSSIKRFTLEFEFSIFLANKVTSWIRFATRRNAENIDLNFLGDPGLYLSEAERYPVPRFLFEYAMVKSLNLQFCEFVPGREICWKVLKNLTIGFAALSNELVEKILSGSPLLESLELYKCCGITRMDVRSASLKKLVVNGYWKASSNDDDNEVLEISGNNLISLSLMGDLYRRKLKVRNVPSLVDATLDFQLMVLSEDEDNLEDYDEYGGIMRGILESIHHAQEVTVGYWCLHVLSMCEIKAASFPLSKYKCLKLDTHLKYWDLPGIALLLRSSSDLEKLVINMACGSYSEAPLQLAVAPIIDEAHRFDGKNNWTSQEMRFSYLLRNLHTVEIVGFVADPSNDNIFVSLMQFFLKNAGVLKRMVIHPLLYDHNKWWMRATPRDLLNVGQSLLSFPRSSPLAEIILYPVKNSN